MAMKKITLIPYSCIQHYDFVIELTGRSMGKLLSYINDAAQELPTPLLIDEQSGDYVCFDGAPLNGDLDAVYSVSLAKACQAFAGHWLPLPYFKNRRYQDDQNNLVPLNWARLYIGHDAPDGTEDVNLLRKAVVAFDTELQTPPSGDAHYTQYAPDLRDLTAGEIFSVTQDRQALLDYIHLGWVKRWINSVFAQSESAAKLKKRGEHVTEQALQQYALAHYLTLVYALQLDGKYPYVTFVDTVSANERRKPIKVDFVLDVGNSRSCGMIVERHESRQYVDLNNSYPIKLRSLSNPTDLFSRPFPSRLEFARPNFGSEQYSRQSGRDAAFIWPSAARVGWEAEKLACYAIGNEGNTGMSSPKRYLWSTEVEAQEWYFNHAGRDNDPLRSEEPVTNSAFFTHFDDQGEFYRDKVGSPAATAHFCKSSLMTFFLTELLLQVLTLINNPQNRAQRRNESAERVLDTVVLTMPTAMTKPERNYLDRRLNDAIDNLWIHLGSHVQDKPKILLQWDEASATQAVFLYNEVVHNFLGDVRSFFAASSQTNSEETLRIASIDIGGGTSDLIITTYQRDGEGLFPTQEFREGFNIAGDDILYDVIEHHVLPAIAERFAQSGVSNVALLMSRLFGSNFGDQSQQERTLRQQTCTQILMPFGYALLSAHEDYGMFSPEQMGSVSWQELFTGKQVPGNRIIDYLHECVEQEGGSDFDIRDLVVRIDHAALYKTIHESMAKTMSCFSEIIFTYDCDYLLMAGRPSRLPAVQALVTAKWPISPDRLIFMDRYKVGQWYPYRQVDGSIGDPKTCASVGAMLCVYSESMLLNFHLQSTALQMRSTARFIGKAIGNKMRRDDVLFSNINLDETRADFGTAKLAFTAPITLGFRQLDLERWPTTMLYRMEYTDGKFGRAAPYDVSIEKIPADEDRDFKIFEISDIEARHEEAAHGLGALNKSIRLRLQTLADEQGFWQDSGIFNV